jgi:acetyl esterase/lipase
MVNMGIAAVRELLAVYPDVTQTPIEEIRVLMDQFSTIFPVAEGIAIEPVNAGGVPGEWVTAPGARKDAAILYLHGGGYVLGSPDSHRHLVAALAEEASAAVLSLRYRLAPEHPFPAAVEDAVTGYRWLLAQGFSPARIGIAGDSAGGGLTVATLVALRDAGDPRPATGICLSPWVDLTCSAASYPAKADADPMVQRQGVLLFASQYLQGKDPKTPLASPLFANLKGLPPLLIHVGSEEVLLDDAIGLDTKATKAQVDSVLEIWEGMIHVWHVFHPMLKEGRDAIRRIGEHFNLRIS